MAPTREGSSDGVPRTGPRPRPLPRAWRGAVLHQRRGHLPQPQERHHPADVDRADAAGGEHQLHRLLAPLRRRGGADLRVLHPDGGRGGSGDRTRDPGHAVPQPAHDQRRRTGHAQGGSRCACGPLARASAHARSWMAGRDSTESKECRRGRRRRRRYDPGTGQDMAIATTLLLIIVRAPLLGAIVAGFSGRQVGRAGAHWVTILGVALSCALSSYVLYQLVGQGAAPYNQNVYTFFEVGRYSAHVGFMIDNLTAMMMVVVT